MSDLAAQPACAPNTCVSCSYTNLKQVLECSAQYRACVTKDLKNSIIYVEISSCSSASACKAENPQAERRVFCSALQHANRVLQQANKCQNILSTYLHGDGIVLEERDASNNLLFLPPQNVSVKSWLQSHCLANDLKARAWEMYVKNRIMKLFGSFYETL